MITYKNYYNRITELDLKKTDISMTLWKGWDFVNKITSGDDNWDVYESSEAIKRTVDLYFVKFGEFLAKEKEKNVKPNQKRRVPPKAKTMTTSERTDALALKMDLKNHFNLIQKKGVAKKDIPKGLVAGWELIERISKNKNPWEIYNSNKATRTLADQYFEKIRDFAHDFEKPKKSPSHSRAENRPKKNHPSKKEVNPNAKKVEDLSVELKFLKRYINLHNKEKKRSQIRLFISALQKAIRERKITKASEFAKEIREIQSALITLHSSFKNDNEFLLVSVSEKKRTKILLALGKQIQMASVKFIKSYITLQGKLITNKQAHSLHTRIVRAYNAGKVTKRDKYWDELESIMDQLATFIEKNPNQGLLRIESRELNGLSGIVLGCPCDEDSLDGFDTIPEQTIMNSMDIVKLNFKKLDFKGKWREFIGNPSKGFSAMIFAKPKMGKSYMSVDWAGYLANNHGTVLYVAKEEGIDETLQMKLREKAVMHPDLYVANYMPEDLSKYDFVFLDSITKLKLTPSDLAVLEANYPNISFISIFQVTKSGNFRGNNGFQHEVDVVIEIPEKGKAIQYGRFNQGGEMDVFDDMGD